MAQQVKQVNSKQKQKEYTCPNCSATQPETIPVWESVVLYNKGMAPKFIGCCSCGTATQLTKDNINYI